MAYVPIVELEEESSARYTATLVDEDEVPVVLADLVSLTLWLRDVASGAYINSRQAQDVLNANGVTFHATSGLLTWQMTPADNACAGTTATEIHEAVFQAIWDEGNKGRTHRVYIKVKNLAPIT